MPFPALVRAVAFERIVVEIVLAVAAEARHAVVVERLLEDVGILAFEIDIEHALGPEDHGDRGAGLAIGRGIGQVVILGEALVATPRGRNRR